MKFFFKNIFFILLICFILLNFFFMCTYLAVPFFKLLCQNTGPNGLYGLVLDLQLKFNWFKSFCNFLYLLKTDFFFIVNNDKTFLLKSNEIQNLVFEVQVVYKINDALPLEFFTQIDSHKVCLDNTELILCKVKNLSDTDIVFTSIYNVYPNELILYVEKIQCFCYDDQIIESGQELILPVYYKINSTLLFDPVVKNLRNLILSYSIFRS